MYKKADGQNTTLAISGIHWFLFVGVFMGQPQSVTAFRPAVSADDWKTIMEAIKAYSHNAEYRGLLERLERQAVLNGIIKPNRLLS